MAVSHEEFDDMKAAIVRMRNTPNWDRLTDPEKTAVLIVVLQNMLIDGRKVGPQGNL